MAKKNVVREKSFEFAAHIVKTMRQISENEKEFVLTKQLMESATAVGSNVEEAIQGSSTRDFIRKLSNSNKELYKSAYWIKLLMATELLDRERGIKLLSLANELKLILVAILKTTKASLNN